MATANDGRFSFVPGNIDGSIIGASQVQPTGMDGNIFYEIWDGNNNKNSLGVVSGNANGKMVGVIAYDYINARWSCLFTAPTGIKLHQNTTFLDDIGAIKAFMATLSTPVTTDEAGNDLPYGLSIPPIKS